MAREVDANLEKLYGPIYIEGTCQAHANSLGIERRLEETENGTPLQGLLRWRASLAIQFAHRLLLRLIDMQNRQFGLDSEQAIGERFAVYNAIWSESQASANNAP